MSDAFFRTSKIIANDFLQSVVFVDDRAFVTEEKNNEHEFNAVQITRAFANSQKVCAVYRPESIQDIDNLAILAKKADVTVLDWRIDGITDENEGDENGEEDADEIDPRGPHTLKIIRTILADPLTGKGSLKLILIYTGETDLPGITDAVHDNLQKESIENVKKGDCTIFTENIRILVLAKRAGKGQFKHNPELKNKIVSYEDLPDFILMRFTEMTAGLLTNFVLQSLTAIRANTFRFIKLYQKDLDASFVMHRLLLPNREDSEEQLIETLTLSIEALLNYQNTGDAVSRDKVFDWLNSRSFTNKAISIRGKGLIVDDAFIKDWETDGFVTACKNKWAVSNFGAISKSLIADFEDIERKQLHKAGSIYLREENETVDIDCKFSILTHHRSNLKQPSKVPRLTLGTLIKQELPEGAEVREERYYLCIQARCDSVRVNALRKFLFLPLEKADNSKFHFVIEENDFTKLRIKKEAFELRTIKFEPNSEHQVVLASEDDGKYFFDSNHDERFIWLADLKEAHAQREVNNFAAKISRVGLDESEWLRRWAT